MIFSPLYLLPLISFNNISRFSRAKLIQIILCRRIMGHALGINFGYTADSFPLLRRRFQHKISVSPPNHTTIPSFSPNNNTHKHSEIQRDRSIDKWLRMEQRRRRDQRRNTAKCSAVASVSPYPCRKFLITLSQSSMVRLVLPLEIQVTDFIRYFELIDRRCIVVHALQYARSMRFACVCGD